ncbi:Eco57I restriction-modification methylase domain-containing protein [Bernardetia sp. OM2101]|uniref:Eco57I restriction-modification methylase domain-containing protein n=1 Tax=Bernardetia sp. OM2101 TaxID=3344876 RepID=UPI0035D078BA
MSFVRIFVGVAMLKHQQRQCYFSIELGLQTQFYGKMNILKQLQRKNLIEEENIKNRMDNTTYFAQFTDNTYYNAYFLEYEMKNYFDKDHTEDCKKAFENIKNLYNKLDIQELSEAQLEDKFITNVLIEIGYGYTYQVVKKVFGKIHKPDFALFESEEIERISGGKDKSSTENILALCESKAYKVVLDNRTTTTDNPHFQLLRYQSDLKINYGFLTNGQKWRFYDITNPKQDKIYFEIDLEWIIQNDDYRAFQYFYYNFYKEQLLKLYNKERGIAIKEKTFAELNQEYILEVEKDLKELIYGKDSIIEMIGQRFFTRYGDTYSIKEIYANSLVFGFRMLFIAYFESKFASLLFDSTNNYKDYSLRSILFLLQSEEYKERQKKYQGWNGLKLLFDYLNYGNIDLEMPLLNGGLFAEDKAPLLKLPLVLTNQDLEQILSLVLYHKDEGSFKTFRDYKTLSVTHLGNIYEGLLESEFRQAFEGTYYLTFLEGKTEKEGYFDNYDYQNYKKDKKVVILEERFYKNDELYLSNQSGNRKTTASYYTPQDITHFMAEESIQKLLKENEIKEKSILDLRVMDNACGSGHFLIATLDVLTSEALKRIDNQSDEKLKQTLETEKEIILQNLQEILQDKKHEIDELTLLKRILLKKNIFGVDLNEFAIELTRLSLWLDSFIFGTPLSFIEHHIKQGNALIGARKEELYQNLGSEKDLFSSRIKDKITELIAKLNNLSNLKDTTAEEIKESKKIYNELQPSLEQLNLALHFYTYKRFIPIIFEDKELRKKEEIIMEQAIEQFEKDIFNRGNEALIKRIEETAKLFNFFNYDISFAEVFQNGHSGFDLIIGNPPWDVMEFNDSDFFSMWRSSYRTMKNQEKKETRQNVLGYKGIQNEYDTKKSFRTNGNEYCKNYYPYNGGGKGNLFRFFIEQNLGLLTKDGTLTYITPSAWIYEDSSINLRKHIFENYQLEFFYQFENKKAIFPDVHRSYKFAVFQITQLQNRKRYKTLPVRFMQTDTEILYKTETYDGKKGILYYPYEDIYTLSPIHNALFEIKDQKDLEILRSAYKRFEIINPDYIDFRNELNMTSDRDLFQEIQSDMILYEGKMIHQYTNNLATPNYWIKKEEFEAKLIKTETSRLVSDIYEYIPVEKRLSTKKNSVLSFLELNEEEDLEQFVVLNSEYYRLVFRDIARNTDYRSIICGIIPPQNTYGNTLQGSIPKRYILKNGKIEIEEFSFEKLFFVQAILNSLVVDYIIRFLIDIHVNKTYLMRLPIPQPTDKELSENKTYQTLIKNALLLNLSNATNLEELKGKVNFEVKKSDIPTTQKQKDKLQAENDLLIADLYGLTKEQLKHLTSPAYFKILNDKNKAYLSLLE